MPTTANTPTIQDQCTLSELRDWIEQTAAIEPFASAKFSPDTTRHFSELIDATEADCVNGGLEWTGARIAVFIFLIEAVEKKHGRDTQAAIEVLMPMLSGVPRELQDIIHLDLADGAMKMDDSVRVRFE